jgi:malate synthase
VKSRKSPKRPVVRTSPAAQRSPAARGRGAAAAVEVRRDIYDKHKSLFGKKTVNGRNVDVEELIAQMTRETKDEFRTLLGARHAFQDQVGRRERSYSFLAPDTKISDADGNTTTVRDIRQGMIDGFFGRKTRQAWRLNPTVPIPKDTMKPGLEGTGPAIDLGMAMGALNTGAASWMWDWEDAGGDYKDQLYQAWENLRDLLAHKWDSKPYVHPTKKDAGKPREYKIDLPPAKWPTIFHRVPGLHLQNRQIAHDAEQVPAMIPALVIHAVSNYDAQKKNGSGIYYYVPKIETWQEARLVAKLLKSLEQALGLRRGTLKIKMLNERAEYALQQEAIMWVLRENLIGPNVGRWDYLNSREEMFRHDPAMVIPDPNTVTMTEPSLTYYTMRNALLALLAGGMPIGGMAAQMQNPRAPENDVKALRDIWFDKLRERLTGLLKINGKLHDTYRQSWVATIAPSYVEAGREPLVTDVKNLQAVVDKLKPEERKRLEDLGLLKDGAISPMELSEADLTVDKLFSEDARRKLLSRPQGPTTEDGLRYAMYMSTEFMYQQLMGNNAAAIYDPRTGLRFMNDLATYEIFWHFLYLTVFHGVELTADGKYSKKGDRVTPELFLKLLDERRETVKELFKKLGTTYENTNAELVLTVLKRQVVEPRPDGRVAPQSRWIKYGSRVLLSIIEEQESDRSAILEGIFSKSREELVEKVESARDAGTRALAQKVLRAYDFVYDARDESATAA